MKTFCLCSVRSAGDGEVAGGEDEGRGEAGQQGGREGEVSPSHRGKIRTGQYWQSD